MREDRLPASACELEARLPLGSSLTRVAEWACVWILKPGMACQPQQSMIHRKPNSDPTGQHFPLEPTIKPPGGGSQLLVAVRNPSLITEAGVSGCH